MKTSISFLDHDAEIRDACRYRDTVSVEVRAGGDTLRLHFHEDLFALLAQAALAAEPYQPELEPEPEPERVLATDLQPGDVIRWQVPATHIENGDGRVEELRPFIKRTALIERKVAAR